MVVVGGIFFFGHRLRARWGLVLHLTGRSMAGSFVSSQVSVTWLMSSYPRWWSHQENPQLRLSAVPPSSCIETSFGHATRHRMTILLFVEGTPLPEAKLTFVILL